MKKVLLLLSVVLTMFSCGTATQQSSDSGIAKATIKIKTDAEGHSIEQKNIMERLVRDNDLGSVKFLYIISSFTGDVLQYSTVKGKVTSGGKRLSPRTVNSAASAGSSLVTGLNVVNIGDRTFYTDEVLDDGGAYGDSGNYLYWFDAQGNYQQYYPSGGTYLHISDRPLKVKKANLSVELSTDTTKH